MHQRSVGLDRFCLWNQGPSVNGRGRRGFVQLLHGDEDAQPGAELALVARVQQFLGLQFRIIPTVTDRDSL